MTYGQKQTEETNQLIKKILTKQDLYNIKLLLTETINNMEDCGRKSYYIYLLKKLKGVR